MRKFLFSFVAVLAFSGLFGLQSASSQGCIGTESLACSGGGPFYGFHEDIFCWTHYLWTGGCGGSPAGTQWTFIDIESGIPTTFTWDPIPE
jgi:hypothetical protein